MAEKKTKSHKTKAKKKTEKQEFVPKIVAVMLALVLFSPWMVRMLVTFTARILMDIPMYAK